MLARVDMAVDWFPDWSNQPCAVVASGKSVTQDEVDLLKSRCRVIIVNNNYRMAPWADVLYAADARWWDCHPDAKEFAGIKVCAEKVSGRHNICRVDVLPETCSAVHTICTDPRGTLGRGGHGGFQALNLAVQCGAKPILLLGFDLCGEHWHEKHPLPLKNPSERTLRKWRQRMDAQAPLLAKMGIDVINCSPVSALTDYRKMSIADALSISTPLNCI